MGLPLVARRIGDASRGDLAVADHEGEPDANVLQRLTHGDFVMARNAVVSLPSSKAAMNHSGTSARHGEFVSGPIQALARFAALRKPWVAGFPEDSQYSILSVSTGRRS